MSDSTPTARNRDAGPAETAAGNACALRLYISGMTPRSTAAIGAARAICRDLPGCRLEVIDIYQHPQLAADDRVRAVPTLICRAPPPERRIMGDLSDAQDIMQRLALPGPTSRPWPGPRGDTR